MESVHNIQLVIRTPGNLKRFDVQVSVNDHVVFIGLDSIHVTTWLLVKT